MSGAPHPFRSLPVRIAAVLLLAACSSRPPPPPTPPLPTPTPLPSLRLPTRGTPLVDFDRIAGWTVSSATGKPSLVKNSTHPIWGEQTAEIRFTPSAPGPHSVTLRPPEPWPGPTLFNSVTLWVWDDGTPDLRPDHAIHLQVLDTHEVLHEIVLPYRPQNEWQMLHLRVPNSPPGPLRILALEWRLPATAIAPQRLLLEGLHLYQEQFGRIPQAVTFVRPHGYSAPFAPLRSNSVLLDFPTRPAAFRPPEPPERSIVTLRRLDGETHALRYETSSSSLEYRVIPAAGAPRIQVRVNDRDWPQVWSGFGVENSGDVPELRFARIEDQKLTLQYSQGLRYEISLHGRSLQIEAHSLSESVSALRLGELGGGNAQETFPLYLPFLRLSPDQRWPVVRLRRGGEELLVSCFPDWWFSLAGRHEAADGPSDSGGETLGRMSYSPRWRGSRNIFRERIYLNVSTRLSEVLPSPAAPPAFHRSQLSSRVWMGPHDDDSIPAPGLQEELLRILPRETFWSEDQISRHENGDWRPYPDSGFILKTGRLPGQALIRLSDRMAKTPAAFVLSGAATAFPPWFFTDYDSRMTGGGTYTQAWAERAAFYQQAAAEINAPLLAEGGSEWLMAGFFAGFLPDFPFGLRELHPFLPHIAWNNLQPVSALLGLGDPADFSLPGDDAPDEALLLDRMIATQIAYGACGQIPDLKDPGLRLKAHRLLGTLQTLLDGRTCERIAYAGDNGFVDAAEALRLDVLHRSRLYLRLDDQTEIWVNGDLLDAWTLRVDDQRLVLPPFGFVLRGPKGWVIQALNEQGKPFAATIAPEQVWLHSPQGRSRFGGLELHGSACVTPARDNAPAQIELDMWTGDVSVDATLLGLRQAGTVRGEDQAGNAIAAVPLELKGDVWVLRSDAPLRRVSVHGRVVGAETKFLP